MKEIILDALNEIYLGKGLTEMNTLENDIHLRLDLGLDSFDLAELTVRIEEKTGKDIFERGIVNTIGEVIEILQ